jgi:hypothetical protein
MTTHPTLTSCGAHTGRRKLNHVLAHRLAQREIPLVCSHVNGIHIDSCENVEAGLLEA